MSTKMTVLVVDDNELNMKMATDLLEMAGLDVLQAEDAFAGLKLAKGEHPDLILMDMHMPICDGYEATHQLKADPETCAIPILAFTAMAMEDEQQRAIHVGCSGIICKPIDVDSFADTVKSYLYPGERAKISSSAEDLLSSCLPSASPAGDPASLANGAAAASPRPSAPSVSEALSAMSSDEYESFINRVSHDLQSPLRKIRQFSGFLKEGAKAELSPDNYTMLEALDRSANQMYDLLSDLLMLSRVGRLESGVSEFSLREAINEAIQKNQGVIDEKRAVVELGEMATLEANYPQMVQLFGQLIENSLKYCPPERVPHILIGCKSLPAEGQVEIQVRDNGLGFKNEYAEQIFQPLQRLHGVSKFSGTGVGLAIVKKIVVRHHGSIHVVSQPDQGATFTLRFPRRQPQ